MLNLTPSGIKLTPTGAKINTNLVWTSHNTGGVEFNTGVFAVQEKGGGFVKIYSNSIDSNLFRGSNLRQNPCLGGQLCILTKMSLGVHFKTFVHACVHHYS